jgi:hypothetical protein
MATPIAPTGSTGSSVPTALNLADLSNVLLHFQDNARVTVQQQDALKTELDKETQILQQKQTDLSNRQSTNARLVAFNQSFSKRYVDYVRMIVSIAIGLAILMVIISLTRMGIIGDTVATLLGIVVMAVAGVFCFQIYTRMLSRDNMDYDKIQTTPPPDSAFAAGALLTQVGGANGNAGLCIGSQCCDDRTAVWNVDKGACVKKEGMTDAPTAGPAPAPASASDNNTIIQTSYADAYSMVPKSDADAPNPKKKSTPPMLSAECGVVKASKSQSNKEGFTAASSNFSDTATQYGMSASGDNSNKKTCTSCGSSTPGSSTCLCGAKH